MYCPKTLAQSKETGNSIAALLIVEPTAGKFIIQHNGIQK